MTPTQAAWLRKLRDEGPQRSWASRQPGWREAYEAGHADFGENDDIDFITPAGIAALEEWEAE